MDIQKARNSNIMERIETANQEHTAYETSMNPHNKANKSSIEARKVLCGKFQTALVMADETHY